jgi:hypothetical protein
VPHKKNGIAEALSYLQQDAAKTAAAAPRRAA